ncbi:MAG: phosphatidate cytidylyltransferase [Candidatus Hydrogenedentota bacterium]
MSPLALRALVAVLGGAILLAMVFASASSTFALFLILLLPALLESLKLIRATGQSRAAPFAIAIILIPFAVLNQFTGIVAVLTILNLLGLRFPKLLTIFYPAQVVAGFTSAAFLRADHGPELLLAVLLVTWSADTGAYAVGMKFGRTKLAPDISPGKTREGAVGGLILAILVGILAAGYTGRPILGAIFGLIAGTAGQMGDLIESRLKRMAGVKDSGKILPGHGGILDRFDAFLVNAPLCYFLADYFARP